MIIQQNNELLKVEDLRMYYSLISGGFLKAVDGVSFSLSPGERLGVVGESGCGKTSLCMTLMGLLTESAKVISGKILFEGRNVLDFSDKEWRTFRWEKMSMIFQAAMNALDPVYRVGKQLCDVYRLHRRCSKKEAAERVTNLFQLTGLPASRMRSYPHQLSGGMKQRVIIAMSLLCDPSLIIADEPATGLDVIIQDQILREMLALIKQLNLSMLLITHDISIVTDVCNRILVMYGGKVAEIGEITEVFSRPAHPYTIGLLQAIPSIRGPIKDLSALKGVPPNLSDNSFGCRFAPRCPRKEAICDDTDPPSVEVGENHISTCFFAEDPDLKNLRFGDRND